MSGLYGRYAGKHYAFIIGSKAPNTAVTSMIKLLGTGYFKLIKHARDARKAPNFPALAAVPAAHIDSLDARGEWLWAETGGGERSGQRGNDGVIRRRSLFGNLDRLGIYCGE